MIKKTLFFGNPAYLSVKNSQLVVKRTDPETRQEIVRTVPIEDIGVVVLEDGQITITNVALDALIQNNCSVITCDEKHMPAGMLLPLDGNTIQSERFANQIEASLPLKKQLWQQTVQAKIRNQASVLKRLSGVEVGCMLAWANDVKSGDSDNLEGRAAAYYWKNIFPSLPGFTRDREGEMPNNLLNYGYAIVRAVVARALVASGLLPTLGIHHHNRYNAYCLADDIMEPYRPYVDETVINIMRSNIDYGELTPDLKKQLLCLPVTEVVIGGQRSPLMVAASQTTASLCKCYSCELRKIVYPTMEI
ncbi:MAG: type II CRISPR-associated endonuclease Cas1 [Bacteroidales bacterium]|nr:type II CRISPR-associated endonuclease Cas1 [Bacteroidales bacterium]